MLNYDSCLRELSGKEKIVNMQVTKPTQQKRERSKNVLLSIIGIMKTTGKMGIALRSYLDGSKYHSDVGELTGNNGFGSCGTG